MKYEPRETIPRHPVLQAHPEADGLLWIEGSTQPCLVFLQTCGNPHCDCREVRLHVREVGAGGADLVGALCLEAWFDPATGAIVRPTELTPSEQALMQEAAAALPAGALQAVLEDRDAGHDVEGNLAAATIPVKDVQEGVLQSWLHHATGGRDMASGGHAVAGSLDHAGRTWYLDVLYCPNPDCNCRKFHVVGMVVDRSEGEENSGEGVLSDRFIIQGRFHSPRLEIFECDPGFEKTALAVVKTWLDRNPGKRALFERQYAEVHEIGARALRETGWSPPQAKAPRPKVGRNEACPCGSGKKYKQCCGRG